MIENKDRLVDATKRLLAAGTSRDDAIKSMTEVGLSEQDARLVVEEAEFIGSSDEKNPKKNQAEKKDGSFYSSGDGDFFTEKKEEPLPGSAAGAKPSKPYRRIALTQFRKIVPVLVGDFDRLIDNGGLKKGDIALVCGASGTGKTTFGMQFVYSGAKVKGEKGIYITLEESPLRIKENLVSAFGWDIDSLEADSLIAILKIDPAQIARASEAAFASEKGSLYIEDEKLSLPFLSELPFVPDRIVFDSLSAVFAAMGGNSQNFRDYVLKLFDTLEKLGSVCIVLDETAQNPDSHQKSCIQGFLADCIIALYSLKTHNRRESALEILKLRGSSHMKRLVPYKITPKGFEIYPDQEFFFE